MPVTNLGTLEVIMTVSGGDEVDFIFTEEDVC